MGRRYVREFNAVAKEALWNRWFGAHFQFNRVARQRNERSRETLGFETRAERDLMLVLHRPFEPTPQKRTSFSTSAAANTGLRGSPSQYSRRGWRLGFCRT